MIAGVDDALRGVFGLEALRLGQAEVIDDVMAGRPVIAVMPTGAGKSLCYQLPAVLLGAAGQVTLVVSPLIALMKDQVDVLRLRGVAAAALTSAASASEQTDILEGIRAGHYTIVYVAPERFRSPRFLDALAAGGDRLGLLAIDEAHCISEWGHDFRPDYRRLGEAVARIRPPRLVALTATATPEVRTDIGVQLGMREPALHVHGFDRPSLSFVVERAGGAADKAARLVERVRMRSGGSALVYAATRKNAEAHAGALAGAGMRVRAYHAGLDDGERASVQDAYMAGKLDAIVATNAFGMGIDKPDIRLVVHADLPRSPEAYYQEAGRGGRDGRTADCVLLFNHGDVRLQEFLIDASCPSPEVLRAVWSALRKRPDLGADVAGLARGLPGSPHASTVESAVRILLRAGYLAEAQGGLQAINPKELGIDAAPLDAEAFARRGEVERGKLRRMVEYAYHPRCRRQFILDYFGDLDWRDGGRGCAGCDNCQRGGSARPLDEKQRFEVKAALSLVAVLSGRFGRTKLAALATASDDDNRLVELPERGMLRGRKPTWTIDLLRALEGAGLLATSRGEYPTVSITRRGEQALRGSLDLDEVGVQFPPVAAPRAAKTGSRSRRRPRSGRARA